MIDDVMRNNVMYLKSSVFYPYFVCLFVLLSIYDHLSAPRPSEAALQVNNFSERDDESSSHSFLPVLSVDTNLGPTSNIDQEDPTSQYPSYSQATINNNMKVLATKHHVLVTLLISVSTISVAVLFQDVSVVLETSGKLSPSRRSICRVD